MDCKIPLSCILCAVLLSASVLSVMASPADAAVDDIPGIVDDPPYEWMDFAEMFKESSVGIVSMAVNMVDDRDSDTGGDVRIVDTVTVNADDAYRIGDGKTYQFSKTGSIDVKENGRLVFGTNFDVSGDTASILLEKGSSVTFLGKTFRMESSVTVSLKGSFHSAVRVGGSVTPTALQSSFSGNMDLNGSLSIGDTTVEEFHIGIGSSVEASLDPDSAVTDIRDVTEDVFTAENGISIKMTASSIDVKIESSLCDAKWRAIQCSSGLSSPKGSAVATFNDVSIDRFSLKVDFNRTKMKDISLEMYGIYSSDNGDIDVNTFTLKTSSTMELIINCSVSDSIISLQLGERMQLTMKSGRTTVIGGSILADLDLKKDAYVSLLGTELCGEIWVEDPSEFTGVFKVPYRSVTHITVGDVVDIGFAGDENAELEILPDINYQAEIRPDRGYVLKEMPPCEYVNYTIDWGSARPDSLIGTYHVVEEIGEYLLTAGEWSTTANWHEVVAVPLPEPVEGMTFFGWTDYIGVYHDTYVMPYHEVWLEPFWSEDYCTVIIDAGTYRVETDQQVIVLDTDTMADVRSKINDGTVDSLTLVTSNCTLRLYHDAVMGTVGGLSFYLMVNYPDDFRDQGISINDGLFYTVNLSDGTGRIDELNGRYSMTALFDRMNENDNTVRSYIVDADSRLTEISCECSPVEDGMMVTLESNVTPHFAVKSMHVEKTGADMTAVIIALIAVALVGLALAALTWRE